MTRGTGRRDGIRWLWRSLGVRVVVLGSLGILAAACSSTSAAAGGASGATSVPAHGGHAHGHHRAAIGVIAALPASELDLRVHGKTEMIRLVATTTYHHGKATMSPAALKAGDRVRVVLATGVATPTAAKVELLPATTTYAGTVGALTGPSFVITSKAGRTHQVTTTGATAYRSGNKSTTAKALSNGETVRVVGEPGNAGSLVASKVIIKPTG